VKLLNIDANAKTVKGQARGYMTAVLYLAPWKSAGVNVCPTAEIAGCHATCLNTAGRGGIAAKRATFSPYGVTLPDNAIQRARIARTRLWAENRYEFMVQLVKEIAAFVKRAERKGLTPCVRLNGTSDILWERQGLTGKEPGSWPLPAYTIFDRFPRVQFYDYTKLPGRLLQANFPANYHLSLSWSGRNHTYQGHVERIARASGAPLVVVTLRGFACDHDLLPQVGAHHIVNGDLNDLRFLDPPHSLVVLRAKGAAKREFNGFVLQE
jgi:hypothetical protein